MEKVFSFLTIRNQYVFYVLILLTCIGSIIVYTVPPSLTKTKMEIVHTVLPEGDGPSTNCFTTFSLDVISSSVSYITCALSPLLDTYVSATPDLLSDGVIDGLFGSLREVTFLLLPCFFVIAIFFRVLELMFTSSSEEKIYATIKKYSFHLIMILLIPTIMDLGIQLCNGLNAAILGYSVHATGATFSSAITGSILFDSLGNSGFIPSLASDLVWILLLISLFLILFFFLMRFVFIWMVFLFFPLLLSIDILPGFQEIHSMILSRFLQFILIQPLFLLGFDLFLLIMKTSFSPFTHILLGVSMLLVLSLLPGFIAGRSGGRMYSTASIFLKDTLKREILRGSQILGVLDTWLNQPEDVPSIKPSKHEKSIY